LKAYQSLELKVFIPKSKIKELSTFPFEFRVRGKIFYGFVVKKNGGFFAYQNLCRHLPITLNVDDGQLLDHDKNFLQCRMHGAQYEIETGHCVAGPCVGANLFKLEMEEETSRLVVHIPENLK